MSATALRWLIVLLLILLLLGACAEPCPPAGGGSLVVDIDPGQPTSTVVDDGVRIEIDNALDVLASFRSGEGTAVSVGGARLGVHAGELTLGERSYGAVSEGDVVRIDAGGVHVGEETRGPLP